MTIFDNEFLKQYLEQGAKLKVYVNREWYDVTDISDVESPQYGLGVNVQGKPTTFRYPQIEQINADGFVITIDQLQDKAAGTEPEDTDAEVEPDADKSSSATDKSEEPAEDEKAEPPREAYRRLVANMIQESKRKPQNAPFESGDFIENVDKRSEYVGSRGVVKNVTMPKKDDSVPMVEYRVYNYGYTFKPGKTVSVPASALVKIEHGTSEPKSKH